MPLVTTVQPTEYAVSLAEAKTQCRILTSDTNHDVRLVELIQRATASVETLTGAMLTTRTVRLDLDVFPTGYYTSIDLGVYPVQSITSIKYDDVDNAEQTLVADTDYWVQLNGMYPCVQAVTYWPATKYAKPNSVRITMQVGYSDVSLVPADMKQAILLRVQELFAHNGETIIGQSVESAANSVKALTDMYRRVVV